MGKKEKVTKELDRRIRRQNIIIIALGIIVVAIYLIIAYIYRGQKFPLPNPF